MIFVAGLLGLISLVFLLAAFTADTLFSFLVVWDTTITSQEKAAAGAASVVCGLVAVGCAIFSTFVIVDAGKVGVQETLGTVNTTPLHSGVHFVNPLSNVVELSVRTENYWMSSVAHEGQKAGDDAVSVRSSNGLLMPVDVSVPYRLIPETAPWVYSNFGKDYVEKLIRPALSTATRRAGSHYTAEELYSTKRDDFAEKTRSLMDEELNKLLADNYKGKNPPESVVVVSQVLIGHVGIPEMVKTAIESKLKADQEQQTMTFTLLKAKQEAERKEIEAKGIQKFQEIVTQGISDKLLAWKGIEATEKLAESHNTKIIIIGSGKHGLPVLMNEDGEQTFQVK